MLSENSRLCDKNHAFTHWFHHIELSAITKESIISECDIAQFSVPCNRKCGAPARDALENTSSIFPINPGAGLTRLESLTYFFLSGFFLIGPSLVKDANLKVYYTILSFAGSRRDEAWCSIWYDEKMESDEKTIFDLWSFSKAQRLQNLCYLPVRVGWGSMTWVTMNWRCLGAF